MKLTDHHTKAVGHVRVAVGFMSAERIAGNKPPPYASQQRMLLGQPLYLFPPQFYPLERAADLSFMSLKRGSNSRPGVQ